MIFSSLWCIKDRDPKQVERKVLFLSKALYHTPPGVKARFTIFWFLLSFLYFLSFRPVSRRRRGRGFWAWEGEILYIYAVLEAPLSVMPQSGMTAPPPGEPSVPASIAAKFVVRQSRKKVHLTTKFSFVHGRKLGSPSGRAGAKRLRGEQAKKAPVPGRSVRLYIFCEKECFTRLCGRPPERPGRSGRLSPRRCR